MDETMNSSREDSIEMAEKKKSVRFADEEAPATKEVSGWKFEINGMSC